MNQYSETYSKLAKLIERLETSNRRLQDATDRVRTLDELVRKAQKAQASLAERVAALEAER